MTRARIRTPHVAGRGIRVGLLGLAFATIVGCGGSRRAGGNPDGGGSGPDGSNADGLGTGIVVNQILGSSSSAFMVAQNGTTSVVVLADKDRFGNPLAVRGVAFFDGKEMVRYEVDTLGRPRSITTPSAQLLFGGYTETTVQVDSLDAGGTRVSREVSFVPGDLEAVRVRPPSLVFAKKDATSTYFQLIDFVDRMNSNFGCVHGAFFPNALKAIGDVLIECAGLSLSVVADQRVATLIRSLAAGVAAAECLGSLVAVPETLGAALYTVWVTCPLAYKAIEEAFKDQPQKPFEGQEFHIAADGSLVERKPGFVTIKLGSATGSKPKTSAIVDLSEIGGSSAQALQEQGGEWSWSGIVMPIEPYTRDIFLKVDGQNYGFAGAIDVAAVDVPEQLTLSLHASKTTVAPGEEVQLVAEVSGGVMPYKSQWLIDAADGPQNVLTITQHPTKTTVYDFGVEDNSPDYKRFQNGELTITVCDPAGGLCDGAGGADAGGGASDGGGAAGGGAGVVTDTPLPTTAQEGCGVVRNCTDTSWPAPPACAVVSCAGDPRGAQGVAIGDPHLRTFDGMAYNLQAVGEFTFAASKAGDFEIQNRTKPWGARRDVAVNAAVAARVAGHRVGIYVGGTVRIDGSLVNLPAGGTTLPGGGRIFRIGGAYTVVWPEGSQLRASMGGDHLDIEVFLSTVRVGQMVGLLGDDNGSLDSELATRAGVAIGNNPSFDTLYRTYAESWRITQGSSLFDYDAGQTTDTFTDRSFPETEARTSDLSQAQRDSAAATCGKAGVVDPVWLDACILDVGLTGEAGFADGLARAAAPRMRMDIGPPAQGCPNIDAAGTAIKTSCVAGVITGSMTTSLTFDATAGSGVAIRAVDLEGVSFVPGLIVSNPNGTRVASATGYDVAATSFSAAVSGTFTIVIYDAASVGGAYKVYLTVAPGANKGGALSPGGVVSGHLDEGALDSYTLTAQMGESVALRVTDVGAGALIPGMVVYGPTGSQVDVGSGYDVAAVSFAAASTGTYTVVLYDAAGGSAGTGDYKLYFTKAPGANKGGALSPGGVVSGHLGEGALDSYTLTAQKGESVALRVTDVGAGALIPGIVVYGPTGSQVDVGSGYDVAAVSFAAALTGTYTVVLYDAAGGFAGTGDYKLYFTKAPGANKGGLLTSGVGVTAHLDEGALDSYTFTAQIGDGISLRVLDVDAGLLVPGIVVYGPTGAQVAVATGNDMASSSFKVASIGTYTVVVYDASGGAASTGNYTLSFSQTPAASP